MRHGEVDLASLLEVVDAVSVELPGRQVQLLQDAWEDVRHEGNEVLLHGAADALRGCHHVLLHGIVARQIRDSGGLDHGLHDGLGVCSEARAADCLGQQGDALEALAEEGAFLHFVQHGLDDLFEERHEGAIVLSEGILDLARDDGDEGNSLLLKSAARLELGTEFLHERLNEGLQILALDCLPVVLECLHTAQRDPAAGVVEALQELRQQLRRPGVRGDGLCVVLGELRHGAPGGVAHARVGGGELRLDPGDHLLDSRLVVHVLGDLRQCGDTRDDLLPSARCEELRNRCLEHLQDLGKGVHFRRASADPVHCLLAKCVEVFVHLTLLLIYFCPRGEVIFQVHHELDANLHDLFNVVWHLHHQLRFALHEGDDHLEGVLAGLLVRMTFGDLAHHWHDMRREVSFEEVHHLRSRLHGLQDRVELLRVWLVRQPGDGRSNLRDERGERFALCPGLDVVDQRAQQRGRLRAHGVRRVAQAPLQDLARLVCARDQHLPNGHGQLLHHPQAIRADARVLAGVADDPHERGHQRGPSLRVDGPLIAEQLDELVA
mmetsp:Transcript_80997/g.203879  ORF Transcript_80997/g.203879 Transcript_80997/m.203879 type:complete len:549 (+) Transcript_80997:1412-3058(+)